MRTGAEVEIVPGHRVGSAPVAERHHALDLIRGLAALSVAQYHFLSWNKVATIESMGTFAVYAFFVLSGLTMMMVYGDRFAAGLEPPDVRSFFWKRGARLLPLLAVVAALSCIKQGLSGDADIAAAILTATGLMALHMPGYLSNSVGAWSLGIEIAFYAVFPVISMLVRSWKASLSTVLALIAAQHLLLGKIGATTPFWDYYISFLVFAPFFALGITISFDRRPSSKLAILPALLGLSAILAYSMFVRTELMRDQASYLLLTLACGGVVWSAWRSTLPAFIVPVASFLGDISYSLYLTHWIVNDMVRVIGLPGTTGWPIFTLVSLIVSYLCYRFFESPVRNWLNCWIRSPGRVRFA